MTYLSKTRLSTLSIASALLLSACGGGGGSGGSTPPTPTPDTTAPAVSFSPSSLSVESETTGSSTLSATDAVGVTSGPTVTCTNGGSFDVATNVFTAAAVTADTTSVCTATASDAAGNEGTGTLTVTMTPPDTTAPVLSFSPATLSVQSGSTVSSTLTATDDVAVTAGPTVSCTNGGAFNVSTNVFTPADVTADTESVCTATASDAAGNEGTATLTVTMTPAPPDTTAPVLTFDPVTVSVQSGSTVSSTLTATDDVAVTTGPTVSCTNGGAFNVSTNVFTPADVTADTVSVCTATASDAAGNEGTATLTATMTPAPASSNVTVSGKLTYDRVPVSAATDGLDYNSITQLPIRQAPVELLDASGAVLDSTESDDNGDYSFSVESGQQVRVRVRSEVQKGAPAEIDLKVVDNTSSDALYALQGPLSVVPTSNQTRDLNADSGWTGSDYTTTRAAAPFALLDTIYTALEGFIAVDSDVDFPAFEVMWSTRNRSEGGDVDDGQIGTSSFTTETRNGVQVPVIRILGDANNDTDEYDVHVVVHEFGHYFENSLSRADSIGGSHSSSDRLDARVAFGEGWGNALSGMILEDPFYRDSFGNGQAGGFNINVENNTYSSTGWYSEGSVQSILYDLYDSNDDGADETSYGLGPIYRAFTDPDYKDTEAFTTIFAFLEALSNQPEPVVVDVEALTGAQLISGSGGFGVGETNDGGISDILPVYKVLRTDGTAVEFCSVDNFGNYNKHGNRRFFRINIQTAGSYQFTMTQTTAGNGDPDFYVYKDGVRVGVGGSGANRLEQQTFSLAAGNHVMDAHAYRNVEQGGTTGDVCYNFTVEAQ